MDVANKIEVSGKQIKLAASEVVYKKGNEVKTVGDHVLALASQTEPGHIKLQEGFKLLNPTNESGWWRGSRPGIRYAKNDMGFITLCLDLIAGKVSSGTNIATLPNGYRPVNTTVLPIHDFSHWTGSGLELIVQTGGYIMIRGSQLVNDHNYVGSVIFYAGS